MSNLQNKVIITAALTGAVTPAGYHIPETPEQAAAHLLLEVLHHLRQARLGIVQLLRRPAQAAQLNDCQKCPDFFVVHCPVRFLSL